MCTHARGQYVIQKFTLFENTPVSDCSTSFDDFQNSFQDLINQGREKVVEATNNVTGARIQPLEDIISSIVSMVENAIIHFCSEIVYFFQIVVSCSNFWW